MFIPYSEKKGSAYFEFKYCKREWPLKKMLKPSGYECGEKDSILVHINNDEQFFESYLKYLESTNAPNGTTEFCFYGVNYYTKEHTLVIIEQITKDKPREYEVLAEWLKKAAALYNGFYLLGI